MNMVEIIVITLTILVSAVGCFVAGYNYEKEGLIQKIKERYNERTN